MALQPFGPEADSAYLQMRQVARLVHEMNSLEQQIRSVYLEAAQKVQAEVPVLPALPSSQARKGIKVGGGRSAIDPIEDATVVPTTLSERSKPRATQRKPRVEGTRVNNKPAEASKLSNTDRLHQTLRKLLGKNARAIGHAELASASGLPRGSIGASIKKLVEIKRLVVDESGVYRLI